MRECEARAAELGLPLRWPPEWPAGTYSLAVLRGALAAGERIREYSLAAFHHRLGLGRDLSPLEATLAIGADAGVPHDVLRAGLEDKATLKQATEAAIARGVTGIPTVAVGDELFWGDDRLEAAAARGA
jgi:2-hydroxychromene-2-carboxylate isomerase